MSIDIDYKLNLALLSHSNNDLTSAISGYYEVLELEPLNKIALNNLAVIFLDKENIENAEELLKLLIEHYPDYVDGYCNMGLLYSKKGLIDEAKDFYISAITVNPAHVTSLNNLASICKEKGDTATAIDLFVGILKSNPNNPLLLSNLGNCYIDSGNYPCAKDCYEKALLLEPENSLHYRSLGLALKLLYNFETAKQYFEYAIALDPEISENHYQLALVLEEENSTIKAVQKFQTALSYDSKNEQAFLRSHFTIPILYATTDEISLWRRRVEIGMNQLSIRSMQDKDNALRMLSALEFFCLFYLGYQNRNDKPLQRQYAEFVESVIAKCLPAFNSKIKKKNINYDGFYGKLKIEKNDYSFRSKNLSEENLDIKKSKIRVGYISAYFFNHTVSKLIKGFLEYRSKDIFEVNLYHFGKTKDSMTDILIDLCDNFYQLSGNLESIIKQMRDHEIDIAIFTDIGMHPLVFLLAGAKVAPIQCAFWGHPLTTGLSTVQYFISSELMEPESANDHYTEALLKLPNIGICYTPNRYYNSTVLAKKKKRADFGLEDGKTVFLCCQSLFKYLPLYDVIFPEIVIRHPNSCFVFLKHSVSNEVSEFFAKRIENIFKIYNLDSKNYCKYLQRLSQDDYLDLNESSDIYLDTVGWSGGNTTLEALSLGLPVVTYPGEFMRGRHSYAMLKTLGLNECIAKDLNEYIAISVRLATDPIFYSNVRIKILDNSQKLFSRTDNVLELEKNLIEIYLEHFR